MRTEKEIRAMYAKKPKSILVLDCAYLSKDRDEWRASANSWERENAKSQNQLELIKRKNIALQEAVSGLIKAIEHLRSGVGIQ